MGDSGYIEIEKRDEIKNSEHFRKIDFRINRRPKSLPQVSDHAIDWECYIENRKSAVRCKVEHAFKKAQSLFLNNILLPLLNIAKSGLITLLFCDGVI